MQDTVVRNICKRYEGYCMRCCIHERPDIPVVRNYKTKEFHVAQVVRDAFPEFGWIFDRMIEDGCSKKRPDMKVDFGSHVLVIEVDENAHKGYTCETKRDTTLWQDVGERNIVFVRFNPDAYPGHSSCWRVNKQGICVVRDEKEWQERLEMLKIRIKYWTKNEPTKMITREHLFF
jgi:hypothetical protein